MTRRRVILPRVLACCILGLVLSGCQTAAPSAEPARSDGEPPGHIRTLAMEGPPPLDYRTLTPDVLVEMSIEELKQTRRELFRAWLFAQSEGRDEDAEAIQSINHIIWAHILEVETYEKYGGES